MRKGYFHLYTGDGKGKTTAAIGLAIRAAGAGMKVFFCQFMKTGKTGEIAGLARFPDLITVERYGTGRFVRGKPAPEDVKAAREGLARAAEAIDSGRYDIVILDEAAIACWYGMFPVQELLNATEKSHGRVEIVVTGRNADPALADRADLVTEMKKVRHYFDAGVEAREGIEM